MEINEKIKNRRQELNLTMLQVAEIVGVSDATISRWESGDIKNMRRDKIVLLANALKISPLVIMGWDTEDEPKPKTVEIINDIDVTTEEIGKMINNATTVTTMMKYNSLSDKDKYTVRQFIDFLANKKEP